MRSSSVAAAFSAYGREIALATLAASIGASVSEASAQAVRGRVLDEDTGIPVSGAMVVLTDSSGERAARRLTDDLGKFLLNVPAAGFYTLRTDRIGYASVPSPSFRVAPGDTISRDVVVPVEAVALAEITVGAERRCVLRPDAGADVVRVWEEARKALAAASFTDETAAYRYRIVEYERESDIDAPTVATDERRTFNEMLARRTYVSRPVEELMAEGFVQERGDEHYYLAPDARTLLSPRFLERYCMHAVVGEEETEGLVGLAFEPSGKRDEVDVRGVLWLDAQSAELQWLDFLYVNLTASRRTPAPGGRIVFSRLPNGTWVVREWRIRRHLHVFRTSPFFGSRTPRPFVSGIHETGGVVLRVLTPEGELVMDAASGTVEGGVSDSLRTRPLPGTLVFAVGTRHADVTDMEGRFRLAGLAEGAHRIAYRHPALDEAGYRPPPVEVEARRGEIVSVRLPAPPGREWVRDLCPGRDAADGVGAIAGIVLDANSVRALAGVRVFAAWSDRDAGTPQPGGADDQPPGPGQGGQREAATDRDGRFLFCGAPVGLPVLLAAEGTASPSEVTLGEAKRPRFVVLRARESGESG